MKWLILLLPGCTSLAMTDAAITNTILGRLNAPDYCIAENIPHDIVHTNFLGTSQACGGPAAECVNVKNGIITMYLPRQELVTAGQYRLAKKHAECHVYQIYHYGDFSHQVFN